MERTQTELRKILTQKFIQVTLKDGSIHAGFIGNPEDFKDAMPDEMVLINGLLRDTVALEDIIDVEFPPREDTINIPVVDEDDLKKENK